MEMRSRRTSAPLPYPNSFQLSHRIVSPRGFTLTSSSPAKSQYPYPRAQTHSPPQFVISSFQAPVSPPPPPHVQIPKQELSLLLSLKSKPPLMPPHPKRPHIPPALYPASTHVPDQSMDNPTQPKPNASSRSAHSRLAAHTSTSPVAPQS